MYIPSRIPHLLAVLNNIISDHTFGHELEGLEAEGVKFLIEAKAKICMAHAKFEIFDVLQKSDPFAIIINQKVNDNEDL